MAIIETKDYDEMSKRAANMIFDEIVTSSRIVLGLPTGSTPEKMYEYLIGLIDEHDIGLDHVFTVNLDEYIGLPADHQASYHHYMNEVFFDKVDIPKENILIPNGIAEDLDKEAADYDAQIDDLMDIDLLILGIGRNGHIAFNEPGTSFDKGTHVAELTDDTIEANSRFFDSPEDVPTKAISMGLKTIMNADSIFILASGESKKDAVDKMLNGDVTEDVPASILQNHDDMTLIADEAVLK